MGALVESAITKKRQATIPKAIREHLRLKPGDRALSHGLIMLYLGGRMGVPPTSFRALYRRSFKRYIRALRK